MTLVVAAAGCGDSSADKAGSRTTKVTQPLTNTKPTAPPTTTRDQLKEQILADYKKANDAYHDVINAGDPNLPTLQQTHTGKNLQTVQRNTFELKAKGQLGRDGPHSRLTDRAVVEQILETKAVVQDCVVDDGMIIDATTGQLINSRTVTRSVQAELEKSQEGWKVSGFTFLHEWKGLAGCAVGSN